MGRRWSPFSPLFLAIAAGLLMIWIQDRAPASATSGMDQPSSPGEHCPEAMWEICDEGMTLQRAADEVTLNSASVCVDVGYLCAELETTGSQRILRWPADTGRLRIRIPPPPRSGPRPCPRTSERSSARNTVLATPPLRTRDRHPPHPLGPSRHRDLMGTGALRISTRSHSDSVESRKGRAQV